MEKVYFAIYHYSLFGIASLAAFGLGMPLTRWIAKTFELPKLLIAILTLTTGTGIFIVILFISGLLGFLNQPVIITICIIGLSQLVISLVKTFRVKQTSSNRINGLSFVKTNAWWWIGIAIVSSFYLILSPLQPPAGWDALMYHLPYAKFWATHESLAVNEWLRYPLFPYNINLLYAASLAFGNDLMPAIIHGFSAALTAGLIFSIAQRYMDWRIGLIAAIEVIIATNWGWGTAFIDLGLMLFWSAALASLLLRYKHGDSRFSYLAAFFAGIAVGIKYQALFYLPIFIILAITIERRFTVILKSIVIFIVIGGYWYLYNFLISYDPIHPIGGHIFGFWLWNADDLAGQLAHFEHTRHLPEWYLLFAVGAVFFWRRATVLEKGLMISTAVSVLIWAFASGYPRYLVAVYPMLALLSAYFIKQIGVIDWVAMTYQNRSFLIRQSLPIILFVVAIVASRKDIIVFWDRIAPNEQSRIAYLSKLYPGYDLLYSMNYLNKGTLYQLGFEDQIYYLSDSVRGDHFGPGRYVDVMRLANNAEALANHFRSLGVDTILREKGFYENSWDPNWKQYFEMIGRSDYAELYRLK